MKKYEDYIEFAIHSYDAFVAIEKITQHVRDAINAGWEEVYLLPDEDLLTVMGIRPICREKLEAAKEKRRKQYERLKMEFEGNTP